MSKTMTSHLHESATFVCVVLLISLCQALITHAFNGEHYFKELKSHVVPMRQFQPLKTAGGEFDVSTIPRLEPGLRVIHSVRAKSAKIRNVLKSDITEQQQIDNSYCSYGTNIPISAFSLDFLKQLQHVPLSGSVHLSVGRGGRLGISGLRGTSIEESVGKLFGTLHRGVSKSMYALTSFSDLVIRYLRRLTAVSTMLGAQLAPYPAALSGKAANVNANTAAVSRLWQVGSTATSAPTTISQQAAAVGSESGSAAVGLLRRAGLSLGSLTAAATGLQVATMMPHTAHASALKKYEQLSPTQRLATTPLYYISNSRGNSYLQEDLQAGNPEQRIVVYFMSSEDANAYLDEMSQVNSYSANEFRVMTVSMEKVVEQIVTKKQSRKLGRYPMDLVIRIQPSSRQCENAAKIAGGAKTIGGTKALRDINIPMFTARGLAVRRANGEIVTPYYFAYEDLKEDWNKMLQECTKNQQSQQQQQGRAVEGKAKKGSKEIAMAMPPAVPKVLVKDFTEVMCLAKGITPDLIKPYTGTTSKLAALKKIEMKLPLPSKESTNQENKDGSKSKHVSRTVVASSTKHGKGLTKAQVKKALETPGIVPPRREIEMIRRFYRNQGMIRNEFNKAKYIGPKR